MPSVSPLCLLPSFPIIYIPLGVHSSDMITLTGQRPTGNGRDITSRPLHMKKVKKIKPNALP